MTESEQDSFLDLAKQLAELARLETQSHEALARRVTELEAALVSSRKELADVRVRNEKLATQLKAAEQASVAAAAVLDRPEPKPAPAPDAAPIAEPAKPAEAAEESEEITPA